MPIFIRIQFTFLHSSTSASTIITLCSHTPLRPTSSAVNFLRSQLSSAVNSLPRSTSSAVNSLAQSTLFPSQLSSAVNSPLQSTLLRSQSSSAVQFFMISSTASPTLEEYDRRDGKCCVVSID